MKLFSAIGRFFSNILAKLGLRAEAAADRQFTKDAESKAMAFDLYGEDLETDFRAMADAITQAEVAVQTKRDSRDKLKTSKEEAEAALQGALSAYEEAQNAHAAAKTPADKDKWQKAMEEAQKDGTAFEADANRLTAKIADLDAEIEGHEDKLDELMGQLEDIQKEIANLPADKAQAVADHIANSKLLEAYERAMGHKKTANRRPIDAVLEDNKNMAAKTKVVGKIAGVDADKKRDKYVARGQQDAAGTNFQNMLKARAAKKEQATGGLVEQQTETQTGDERPKI
jgi:chromosome segregation ATPase